MTLAIYVIKRNPLLVFLGLKYQLDWEDLNVHVFEREGTVFSTATENFFGQIECQGKTYQAVNKCYTISVSFLPSGKAQ